MYEWSEQEQMIQAAVRSFVDTEIRPHVDDLEHGDMPPYDLLRKMFATFGIGAMLTAAFDRQIARAEGAEDGAADGGPDVDTEADAEGDPMGGGGDQAGLMFLLNVELSRVVPGFLGAMGVSIGLAAGTIMSMGTVEQKKRWARDLLTFDKVGAWAITEPNSGSDAFGGMQATARPEGDGWVLNGNKTFITNGPHADTIVVYAKLDDGTTPGRDRPIMTFVLDRGMDGLTQSPPFRKMGFHSSPTGELFLEDVHCGPDRLLGSRDAASAGADAGRESARANFVQERIGLVAMALGIVEECLRLSVDYARTCERWGKPIGDYQLIQLKLAKMEVARVNLQNMLFSTIERIRAKDLPSLAEASACKLYAGQAATDVALDAVQLFGGNGYMSEYRVEQLARDAKSIQIYAGTDEIQVIHIARGLLA